MKEREGLNIFFLIFVIKTAVPLAGRNWNSV
jgi:hypothetical protein